MATFSFSHTGNYWKTRYSFEPSHYTHIDNALLSHTQNFVYSEMDEEIAQIQETVWKHNSSNVPLNNFYDIQYGSYLAVSSNQDPSAEKVFNAISLESNQNVFQVITLTNVDLQGSSTTKAQQSSLITELATKEENLYAAIPPSLINSTANLRPIGLVKNSNTNNNTVTLYGAIDNIPTGAIPVFVNTDDDGNTTLRSIANVNASPAVLTSESVDDDVSTFFNFLLNQGTPASTIGEADLYQNQTTVDIDGEGILAGTYIVNDQTRLMALLDPSVHGDAMRGKYLLVSLATRPENAGDPFELYAINVEYSHSNLDSRLGQNS